MMRFIYFSLFLFFSTILLTAESFVMPVPLYVDNLYSGEIDLQIDNDIIRLKPHPLILRLKEKLDWNKAQISLNRWNEDQWVTPESLSSAVIHPEFNKNDLILTVIIPPESRKMQTLTLTGAPKEPPKQIYPNSPFSAILNLDSWNRFNYEDKTLDFRMAPELVLQYSGYALETRGGLQSGSNLFYYDYIRVIKDFPSLMYRAEAGDITYRANGFLKEKMVGLSFFRNTSLSENYHSRPPLGRRIFFPEPAEVEIMINNRTVSRHSVPQGTWIFESFPLVQGTNDIVIKWTDSTGDHEDRFFFIYDGKLLKKGEVEMGGAFGTDSYLTFNPALLFHMSNGVTHNLTMGADIYYDANQSYFALGAPILFASPVGTFSLIPRLDLPMTEGVKVDLKFNHSYSEKRDEKPDLSFGSSLGYQISTYPIPSQILSLSVYYNFNPARSLGITPSLGWSWNTSKNSHDLDMRARVRQSTGQGSIISVDLGIRYNSDGWVPTAGITYSASFHEIQQNFYTRGDLSGQKMIMSWNRYSSSENSNDYTLGLSGIIPANNTERLTLTANGGYTHPYFSSSFTQGFNSILSTGKTDNTSILSLGSAMVFADGVLGFSRPVREGFVLVQSDMGPLDVNPETDGALLSLNDESRGVIPSPTPYRYTRYRLVPENLPVGSDINDYIMNVYPTYRSGILLTAQAKVYMYAGGTLVNNEGEIMNLRVGNLEPVGLELPAESYEFFTDDTGYFECYSLIPGDYTLSLKGENLVYNISITPSDNGFCSLGEVIPEY